MTFARVLTCYSQATLWLKSQEEENTARHTERQPSRPGFRTITPYVIVDSMLMIGSGGGWSGNPLPAALYLYIDDVDETLRHALAAGATAMMEPTDEEDGDRRGGVQDPFGNMWFIARH